MARSGLLIAFTYNAKPGVLKDNPALLFLVALH
jgi:hypothetical protein